MLARAMIRAISVAVMNESFADSEYAMQVFRYCVPLNKTSKYRL